MPKTPEQRRQSHHKQERLDISTGVPFVQDLREGVSYIRRTKEGMVEYRKIGNSLYKNVLEKVLAKEPEISLMADDGYVKFGGGFIMQWGHEITDATVTFPIPFPNACFNIVTGKDYADGHGSGMPRVLNITSINFEYDSSNQANTDGYWLAIGY